MSRQKGSLTVESILVMVMILFVFLWIMEASIELYQQAVVQAENQWLETEALGCWFRRRWLMQEIIEK